MVHNSILIINLPKNIALLLHINKLNIIIINLYHIHTSKRYILIVWKNKPISFIKLEPLKFHDQNVEDNNISDHQFDVLQHGNGCRLHSWRFNWWMGSIHRSFIVVFVGDISRRRQFGWVIVVRPILSW